MSVRQIELPEPLDRFLEEQVRSGAYADADAVVKAGVHRLKQASDRATAQQSAKVARVNALIDEALEEPAERIDDLGEWLDQIWREARDE